MWDLNVKTKCIKVPLQRLQVAEDMDEAVLAQLEDAQRPSEARALMEKGRAAWGAPVGN